MPVPRHLTNAPITEAIIDFRVRACHGLQVAEFEKLKLALADRFPQAQQQIGRKITFQLLPSEGQPPSVEDVGLQGFLFTSNDGKWLAQFRQDGFTLNRLKPYTSWDELYPLAREVWALYVAHALPEDVVRLALRYINHIRLPSDLADFSKYMRGAPEIPAELPQLVSTFFVRTTIHKPDGPLAAHVTQAFETDRASKTTTLILDIDAFCEGSWASTDPEIEVIFQELHAFKNDVFFNYLTDDTLRLFE